MTGSNCIVYTVKDLYPYCHVDEHIHVQACTEASLQGPRL